MTPHHPAKKNISYALLSLVALLVLLCVVGFYKAQITLTSITQPSRSHAPDLSQKVISPPPQPVVAPPKLLPDCAEKPCMALTFDDGPDWATTAQILDILDKYRVKASFFVVGSRVPSHEPLLRRMYATGHEVANHSWNHPDFATLTAEQQLLQVTRTQEAIMAAGVPAPTLFRPPYGMINNTTRSVVPLTIALWNIDPLDWQTKDAGKLRDAIVSHARPGGVVDLHDIYPATVQALEPTIQALQPHYQLVTFSELFSLDRGQPGEFFGR